MENGFGLYVTKSRAKRFCHTCSAVFPKEIRHLARKPIQGKAYHYCRTCSLALLREAIKDPDVGKLPKQVLREHYLKIKVS